VSTVEIQRHGVPTTSGPLRRVVSGPTPARLRTAAIALTLIAVVFAASAGATVLSRQVAVDQSATVTEPALVDAQAAYTALSDADTAAAGGLLSGSVEPAAAVTRYQQDLATASAAVTDAARLVPDDPSLSASLRALSVGIPVYAGLVERATTNNRMGYPIASAYLGEASNFLRTDLLSAAIDVYHAELAALSAQQASATRGWPVVACLALLLVLLGGLLVTQWWVRRRFRRTLNAEDASALSREKERFFGVDRFENFFHFNVVRKGKLHQNPIDLFIGVHPLDFFKEVVFGDRAGQF